MFPRSVIKSLIWEDGLAGEVIADGTDFRNNAHLRFKADILVPCGGRYVACSIMRAFADFSMKT